MEYNGIIYEPGKVTRIKLNRPKYLNALSSPLYRELENAFDRAAADEECRVIVLSGEGKCFSVGHDILSPEADPMMGDGRGKEELEEMLGSYQAAYEYWWREHMWYAFEMKMQKWRNIRKPTIAMVQSYCLFGAFFMVESMDLIFASEDARFLSAIGQTVMPPWDLSARKWKELIFEHRFLPAREAYECGLVNRIYPTHEILEKETMAYANRVTENKLYTFVADSKQAVNIAMDFAGYQTAMYQIHDIAQKFGRPGGYPEDEMEHFKTSDKGLARINRATENLEIKLKAEKQYYPEK
jgi:enoyl-CoA hydratase